MRMIKNPLAMYVARGFLFVRSRGNMISDNHKTVDSGAGKVNKMRYVVSAIGDNAEYMLEMNEKT